MQKQDIYPIIPWFQGTGRVKTATAGATSFKRRPGVGNRKKSTCLWSLWAIFLLALCPQSAFAYLDPGTGSMLLSALVGIAATVFFMAKSIYYRAAGIFARATGVPPPNPHGHGIVFYSEGAQYWSTFQPVLEAFEQEGKPVLFLTSDANDPALAREWKHVETRYAGQGNRAFTLLAMLEADVCVMTTPGLDVLQIRRSPGVKHYAHIVHSVTDMSIYKIFAFDYFDSVLCSGPHQIRSLRHLETLRGTPQKLLFETGCLYFDTLAQKDTRQTSVPATLDTAASLASTVPAFVASAVSDSAPSGFVSHDGTVSNEITPVHEKKNSSHAKESSSTLPRLLIAPTWGRNGLLSLFGETLLLPLAQAGYPITLRPHPQSSISEAPLLARIRETMATHANVRWDISPSGLAAMNDSDILISDLSGIVFDYAFALQKPVITVRFEPDLRGMDGSDLPWPAWELGILETIGAHVEADAIMNIPAIIAALPDKERFQATIRQLRQESVYNYGQAGPIAARQILSIQRQVCSTENKPA